MIVYIIFGSLFLIGFGYGIWLGRKLWDIIF
jgi:hypothetical protein